MKKKKKTMVKKPTKVLKKAIVKKVPQKKQQVENAFAKPTPSFSL